jgi:hypothetical protein
MYGLRKNENELNAQLNQIHLKPFRIENTRVVVEGLT